MKANINEFIDECVKSNNFNALVNELTIKYPRNKDNEELYIKVINTLIDFKKYDIALVLINSLKDPNNYSIKLHFLTNKMYEQMHNDAMSKEAKEVMQKNCSDAINEINNNNFKAAYSILNRYDSGKQNIYNYYLGLYFYKIKDYNTAKYYFNAYLQNGFEMLIDCYFYLFNIEYETDGNYNKYYEEILSLSNIDKTEQIINLMRNMIKMKNVKYSDDASGLSKEQGNSITKKKDSE